MNLNPQELPLRFGTVQPPQNREVVLSGLSISCNSCTSDQPLFVINYANEKVILENITLAGGGLLLRGANGHETRGGSITGSRAPNSYGIRIESDDAVVSGTRISGFDRGIAIVGLGTRIGNQCEVTNSNIGIHVQRQNAGTMIGRCTIYGIDDGDDIGTNAATDALRIDGDTPSFRYWDTTNTEQTELFPDQNNVITFRANSTPFIGIPQAPTVQLASLNNVSGITIISSPTLNIGQLQLQVQRPLIGRNNPSRLPAPPPLPGTPSVQPPQRSSRFIEFFISECTINGVLSRGQMCGLIPTNMPIPVSPDGSTVSYAIPPAYQNQALIAIYTDENGSTPLSSMIRLPSAGDVILIGAGPQPITLTTPGATGGDTGGSSVGGDSGGSTGGDVGGTIGGGTVLGDAAAGGVISAADVSTGTRPDVGAPMFEEAIPREMKDKEKEKEKTEPEGTIASNDGNQAGLTGGVGVGPGGGCEQSLLPPPSNRTVVLWLGLWWIITSIGLLLIARPIYQHITTRRKRGQ